MAEEADRESQTEEPTEKKIIDELERGNAPFSKEAGMFASVAAMLIIAAFMAKEFVGSTTLLLERLLGNSEGWSLRNGGDAIALFKLVSWDIFKLLIPLLITFMTAGLLSSLMQNAPRIVLDRIQPKLNRISLGNGWHRLLSVHGQTEFLKGIGKLISISIVAFAVLRWQRNNLLGAMAIDPRRSRNGF